MRRNRADSLEKVFQQVARSIALARLARADRIEERKQRIELLVAPRRLSISIGSSGEPALAREWNHRPY
jgi:flagellar biosynthesis regulator FlaF